MNVRRKSNGVRGFPHPVALRRSLPRLRRAVFCALAALAPSSHNADDRARRLYGRLSTYHCPLTTAPCPLTTDRCPREDVSAPVHVQLGSSSIPGAHVPAFAAPIRDEKSWRASGVGQSVASAPFGRRLRRVDTVEPVTRMSCFDPALGTKGAGRLRTLCRSDVCIHSRCCLDSESWARRSDRKGD